MGRDFYQEWIRAFADASIPRFFSYKTNKSSFICFTSYIATAFCFDLGRALMKPLSITELWEIKSRISFTAASLKNQTSEGFHRSSWNFAPKKVSYCQVWPSILCLFVKFFFDKISVFWQGTEKFWRGANYGKKVYCLVHWKDEKKYKTFPSY